MEEEDIKRCRICLASENEIDPDEDLGRMIRPCLCKGSIQYVHVKCLEQWRKSSPNNDSFFRCPQCHYAYRFARTRVHGIATNPIIVGTLSALLFTLLTVASSFITTGLMSLFDPTEAEDDMYYFYFSPISLTRDLIRAALRILADGDPTGMFDGTIPKRPRGDIPNVMPKAQRGPGLLGRFLLGLPILSASALVQLVAQGFAYGPLHWMARFRTNRRRNDNSRDVVSVVLVVLLLIGAIRAISKVYDFTRRWTVRLLLRAEEAILEVN
ncbi:hypothetical protein DL96DRAFT_1666390 [Flagelloscypha sp. PMI_526]|nr:hypothetical protein DL96DRAFT_1666390 [Flagelloscypha sp. PMI_526]